MVTDLHPAIKLHSLENCRKSLHQALHSRRATAAAEKAIFTTNCS